MVHSQAKLELVFESKSLDIQGARSPEMVTRQYYTGSGNEMFAEVLRLPTSMLMIPYHFPNNKVAQVMSHSRISSVCWGVPTHLPGLGQNPFHQASTPLDTCDLDFPHHDT